MPGITYSLSVDPRQAIAGVGALRSTLAGFNGMVGKLTALAGFTGGLGIAGAAIAGFKRALSEAGDLEDFITSFEVLLGSTSAAQALATSLNDLGAKTHLSMAQLSSATQTMLSFGVAGSDVIGHIRTLSEVSGGNADRFSALALAFSQTAAAGKLMGQDLLQYVNAGFNPLQEISARTGQSMAMLRKEVEAGNISFAQVAEAFQSATAAGGRFYGFTEAKAATWKGQIATLQNRIGILFREFGQPLTDQLKPFLTSAVAMATNLTGVAKSWGTEAAKAIGVMKSLFQSGMLGEALNLSLQIGFGEAVNYGAALLNSLAESVGILIGADIKEALMILSAATTEDFWKGLGNVLHGIALEFVATLERLLAGVLEAISDAPGLGWLKDAADGMRTESDHIEENAKNKMDRGGVQLDPLLEQMKANIATTFTEISEAFRRNVDNAPELVRVTDLMDNLSSLVAANIPATGAAKPGREDQRPGNVTSMDAAAAVGRTKVDTLGDRLSKIGLFIGGSGGPRGQRAAEDTARHTRSSAEALKELVAMSRNPPALAATF